jgi:hypothetical protein
MFEVAVRSSCTRYCTVCGGQIADNHYDATLSQLSRATRLPHNNPSHQHMQPDRNQKLCQLMILDDRRTQLACLAWREHAFTMYLHVLLAHSLSRPSKLLRGLFSLSRNRLCTEVVKARDGGVDVLEFRESHVGIARRQSSEPSFGTGPKDGSGIASD